MNDTTMSRSATVAGEPPRRFVSVGLLKRRVLDRGERRTVGARRPVAGVRDDY